MDGDDNARLIYGMLLLMLLIGSLGARRLPLQHYMKMFLAWIAIFAGAFVLFSFRPEMKMAWERVTGEITGAPRQSIGENTIRLVRQDDGHFWLRAQFNGQPVDLMIDSGASFTAINPATAKSTNIRLDDGNRSIALETANGQITAQQAVVENVTIGTFALRDHDVVVSAGFGNTNVAGMNFLDEFESWNVRGDVMELHPE